MRRTFNLHTTLYITENWPIRVDIVAIIETLRRILFKGFHATSNVIPPLEIRGMLTIIYRKGSNMKSHLSND